MKLVRFAVIAMAATLILSGCTTAPSAAQSKIEQAVFVRFPTKQVTTSVPQPDTFSPYTGARQSHANKLTFSYERVNDGTAIVRLASGAEVLASCAFVSLAAGQTVSVEDNGDGTWTVVSDH